jgi:hypothetical protein
LESIFIIFIATTTRIYSFKTFPSQRRKAR